VSAPAPAPLPAPESPASPSPYGALALRVKQAGIFPNASHPDFRNLVDHGATWEELEPLIPAALEAGQPFAYLVKAAIRQRERAANRPALPPAPPPRTNRQQALEDANRAVGERWAQQETTDHAAQ
jgi:hypothetical protein